MKHRAFVFLLDGNDASWKFEPVWNSRINSRNALVGTTVVVVTISSDD